MSRKISQLSSIELRQLLRDADAEGHGKSVRQKLSWFLFAVEHDANISLTCRHFAITRSTFIRWLTRFDPKDLYSLTDKSRRPDRVRCPETPPEVVALIRSYREQHNTMGKETIRKLLKEEHGIALSASTVGRVIARHHFFFSTQPSHQLKLTAWAVSKEEDVPQIIREAAELSAPKNEVVQEEEKKEEEKDNGTWFGPGLSALLIATSLGASLFGMPRSAHAEESASFIIQTEAPNEAEGTLGISNSFSVQGGVTWYTTNAESTSFQISDEGPQSSSSSSTSSSSTQGAAASSAQPTNNGTGSHGGGSPIIRPPVRGGSSSAAKSSTTRTPGTVHPSAPSLGAKVRAFAEQRRIMRLLRNPRRSDLSPESQNLLRTLRSQVKPASPETRIDSLDGRGMPDSWQWFDGGNTGFTWFDLPALVSFLSLGSIAGWRFSGMWMASGIFDLLKKKRTKRGVKRSTGTKRPKSKARRGSVSVRVCLILGLMLLLVAQTTVAASAPQQFTYKGHLLTSAGTPITSAHSIRFSFWRSSDAVSGDVTGGGAVNTGAANYAGWTEVQTVTPGSNGAFSVSLGSVSALPDFAGMSASDLTSLHLQVEVKSAAAPDTAYEILDVNSANSSIDRSQLLSVPFALNAGLVDQRKPGSGAGDLPYLDVNALLAKGVIPGGTNQDFFTIDADNSVSSGNISLNFGATLGKVLSYDVTNSRFNFNDDVRIQGDLTVTGLINGINLNMLNDAAGSSLRVSSGAGLSVNIEGGSYRVNGDVTDYTGNSGIGLTDDADNYLFFTSTGLTVNTTGFPVDKSYIPVAKVTTQAGSVIDVADRRVLMSDDREQTILHTLHPAFPGGSFKGDGSNNVGQLSQSVDDTAQRSYYVWTSTRPTLNDYDVTVIYTIPETFTHWDGDLTFLYKSTTSDSSQNKLDIQVFDTSGSQVTLSGASTNLVGTGWSNQHIEFTGTPTWTPGQNFLVRMKLSSKDNNAMYLGDMQLRYVELKN